VDGVLDNASKTFSKVIGKIFEYVRDEYFEEARYFAIVIAIALVRAAGKTVVSGHTGLKFSFGRATRVVGPGFHPLIPFLQVIRTLPTRDRTLDLPQQRVTTSDGLVYDVDANLVFRVVDVRRALIEIDDLDKGMIQMLGLGVQTVLRARERSSMYVSDNLDAALSATLARRLEAWGVEVSRAGFTSIKPSPRTMRVTQLGTRVGERERMLSLLEARGVPRMQAMALLGAPPMPRSRTRKLQRLETARRRARRVSVLLDAALAEGALDASLLPPRWRGLYEERAYQGEPLDPRKNLLFRLPNKKTDKPLETAAAE
jgi:hypothetical protein